MVVSAPVGPSALEPLTSHWPVAETLRVTVLAKVTPEKSTRPSRTPVSFTTTEPMVPRMARSLRPATRVALVPPVSSRTEPTMPASLIVVVARFTAVTSITACVVVEAPPKAAVASPRPITCEVAATVMVALLPLAVTMPRPLAACTSELAVTVTPVPAPTALPPVPPTASMPTGPVPLSVTAPVAPTLVETSR